MTVLLDDLAEQGRLRAVAYIQGLRIHFMAN